MRINRRNVLVGLGTIVAGGGAALGTGAFSTATAERDISITTASDSGALIGLEPGSSTWVTDDDGEGVLQINANELNADGTFHIQPAFTVVNNHDEGVYISISDDSSGDEPSLTYTPDSFNLDPAPDSESPDSTDVNLEIDTTDVGTDGDFDIVIEVTADTDLYTS